MNATATFATERADQYLASLCKHFSHKVPARHEGTSGQIEFPFARCELTARSDVLELTVVADGRPELDKGTAVVTAHLERFAFRENPVLDWTFADDARPTVHAP